MTPFDHMAEFKNLDPATKDQIMKKFNSLSPDEQGQVMDKAKTPPALRSTEGVEEVAGPITGAFTLGVGGAEEAAAAGGVKAFEAMPTLGRVAKNIITTPQKTIEAAKSVADMAIGGIKSIGGNIGDAIGNVANAVRNTGAKEVSALTEKAAELPLTQAAKSSLAQTVRTTAKQGIQSAEEKVGLGLTNIQGNPNVLNQAFAVRAAKLADMGPEVLAQKMDSSTLQLMRKTASLGVKQGGADVPLYAKANKAFTEALGLQQPHIQDALSKYNDIEKVIGELPDQFTKEKQTLKLALAKARNLAKSQAPIRKAVGLAASGGFAALGYGVVKKALGD